MASTIRPRMPVSPDTFGAALAQFDQIADRLQLDAATRDFERVQGSANAYWRRDQVFHELEERLRTAFRAVHDMADHGAMSLRDAAYLIAVDRVEGVPGTRVGVT